MELVRKMYIVLLYYYYFFLQYRRSLKQKVAMKYIDKLHSKQARKDRYLPDSYKMDPTDEVFVTIRPEDAKGADKNTFYRVT